MEVVPGLPPGDDPWIARSRIKHPEEDAVIRPGSARKALIGMLEARISAG
jgi:hypothetical protein